MKNINTKTYLLWVFTLITVWFTYAYSSVSSSLNYLKNAWNTGHIGYIITEMFGPDAKIKPAYLPDGMVVENASITQTWIVKLNNATGSTSETEAPTINILTQVWTHLNDRIDTFPQYIHPTGDGNLHVPATSTSNNGKVLTAGSTEWSISWQPLPSAPVSSVAGKTGAVTLVKWDVGLSNVDNTSDANKPVSTATQTELDKKLNKSWDLLTGLLRSRNTTWIIGVNTQWTPWFEVLSASSTDAAYMTFHRPAAYAVRFWLDSDNKLKVWWWSMWNIAYEICHEGNLINTINSTSTWQAATANAVRLVNENANTKAPLVSPIFTGEPTAPTPNTSDVSTKIATTAYVYAKINALAAGGKVSFAWYTALTYNGNLWYKKWADQKCAANFAWSRVMMYDDYVKLGTSYPYTYDIWMIDGGDLVSIDGASWYEYHIPKDWNGMSNTFYSRGNTCKWWSSANTYSAYMLNTAWIMSYVNCSWTYRLACVY